MGSFFLPDEDCAAHGCSESNNGCIAQARSEALARMRTLLHRQRGKLHVARRTLKPTLNKADIIAKIIAALAGELDGLERSARAAHGVATDSESKAENKYDTRGLEASYLAHGQSRQAIEVMQAIQQFETLPVREFAADDAIHVGALVELEPESKRKGERTICFIGPAAGGTEIECEGREVLVITLHSPMGGQLVGLKRGGTLQIPVTGKGDRYRVAAVS